MNKKDFNEKMDRANVSAMQRIVTVVREELLETQKKAAQPRGKRTLFHPFGGRS